MLDMVQAGVWAASLLRERREWGCCPCMHAWAAWVGKWPPAGRCRALLASPTWTCPCRTYLATQRSKDAAGMGPAVRTTNPSLGEEPSRALVGCCRVRDVRRPDISSNVEKAPAVEMVQQAG